MPHRNQLLILNTKISLHSESAVEGKCSFRFKVTVDVKKQLNLTYFSWTWLRQNLTSILTLDDLIVGTMDRVHLCLLQL